MLPRPLRARLHSKILRVLRRQNAAPEALALQAYTSGDRTSAYEYAVRAALAADRRSSITECVYYTELALRVAENRAVKASLRYDLAMKLFRAGLFRKAIKHARVATRHDELTLLQVSE